MPKFRKKPVVIEAVQVTAETRDKACNWAIEGGAHAFVPFSNDGVMIRTLEGDMKADIGDWIIRGVKGEHYPCKPDIFEATYDQLFDAEDACRVSRSMIAGNLRSQKGN